jgi:hypothetical protein
METKVQLKPETSHFVEALQSILQVEESIYSGLTETYGEDRGESMWYKSPLYTFLESAKKEVKILLGDSLELALVGALDRVEDTKAEGVC